MLDFNSARDLANPSAYVQLLDAIHDAAPHDETDWLEWKSELDLDGAKGRFDLSKEILAMANRWPVPVEVGGAGIIVAGLEPGRAPGVAPIDPADLGQRLQSYIGDDLRWSAFTLEFRGVSVLVVRVDAPRAGDRAALLLKAYEKFHAGTIFVRSRTSAAPASAAAVRRLEDRFRAAESRTAAPDLVISSSGPAIPFITWDREPIRQWVDAKVSRLLAPLDPPTSQGLTAVVRAQAAANRSLAAFSQAETRTEEQFRADVAKTALTAAEVAEVALLRLVMNQLPAVDLRIENKSASNLQNLQVEIALDDGISAWSLEEELAVSDLGTEMPQWPRRWGPQSITFAPVHPGRFEMPDISVSDIDIDDTRRHIEITPFDLRPLATDILTHRSVLFLIHPDAASSGAFTWRATATNIDAVSEGHGELLIAGEILDITELMVRGLEAGAPS